MHFLIKAGSKYWGYASHRNGNGDTAVMAGSAVRDVYFTEDDRLSPWGSFDGTCHYAFKLPSNSRNIKWIAVRKNDVIVVNA